MVITKLVFYCCKPNHGDAEVIVTVACSSSVTEVTRICDRAVCMASLLLVPDECWHPVFEGFPASAPRDCSVNAEESQPAP